MSNRLDAIDWLRSNFPKGSTISTLFVRQTANAVRLFYVVVVRDGRAEEISGTTANAIGANWCERGGVWTHGSGQDIVEAMSLAVSDDWKYYKHHYLR